MKKIFDLCKPRADVLEGRLKDEEFAADLSKVIRGQAVREYADTALFFHYTYPTRGLTALLETICRRLSGKGGELNSVIRLDTQYGGGKTHGLIALVHAVRGMQGLENIAEFVDPALLPQGNVRIAALDGENAAPAEGLILEDGAIAHSLWGEMAYRLAGREGFERIRKSDEKHIAPGAETIKALFGGEPALILIDEVSVYLRKAVHAFPDAANQFTAFLQALIKAVTSTPKAALVCTLAISSEDSKAKDAYEKEQYLAAQAFEEAMSVASRQLLQLDPTEEDETVNVLQRRLFESVDFQGAEEVITAYADVWKRNKDMLSPDAMMPEVQDQFRKGYPLHPETLNVMMDKMSSLATFQRTRGMLRFLARTVEYLWKVKPDDAFAIHTHHIDPGYAKIRTEFMTKLNQSAFSPALSADVAAVEGKDPAIAQRLDKDLFFGQAPVVSFVARTIFANTMAFGDAAQGITSEHLRYSVCSPLVEPALVESARKAFAEDSLYLDDRPGAPMRFRVEPNLTQIINRAMKEVSPDEVRSYLDIKIKDIFKGSRQDFETVSFPAGPREVPDEIGSGRPYMVLLHYNDQLVSESQPSELPPDLVRMATRKGLAEDMRIFLNNLIFVMADKKLGEAMKQSVRRRLALESVINGPSMDNLADYQQNKIKEKYARSEIEVAVSIVQCYRHVFYPSNNPLGSSDAKLSHTAIELHNTSDDPGRGQQYIRRALRDQKKLLMSGDNPDSPAFVRDQTSLKNKGQMSVSELLNEYRKAPGLCILMDNHPLTECIRQGIAAGIFIYREGNQLWGREDAAPVIRISDNTFIHTIEDAKQRNIWPRPIPDITPPPEPDETTEEKGRGKTGVGEEAKPFEATDPELPVFSAEGPLKKNLVQIFEDARAKEISAFESIKIRIFGYRDAWTVQQSLTAYRDAEVSCEFDAEIKTDGIERLEIAFAGTLQKANAIRQFLEPQLRSSKEYDFKAVYNILFNEPLSTEKDKADAFIEILVRYGSPETHVDAVPPAPEKESE